MLLAVTVVQTAISLYYLSRAQVSKSLLRNRQAGALLTVSIVMSYIAYAACVLLYLIQPTWLE